MTSNIIDGKSIAKEIREQVRAEVENLKGQGTAPGLATLLVGEDPASQIYLKNKHQACAQAGIVSFNHILPKNSGLKTVLKKIEELNRDDKVHAILVQLPLPEPLDLEQVLAAIDPKKDADGFHPFNLAKLFASKNLAEFTDAENPTPIPCTPQGALVLIQRTGNQIAGKNALVIGRSMIVGKPMAALLLAHNATVTIAHSQTKNLIEYGRQADILVAAIGKPKAVTAEMIKEGAIVIDVGINRLQDQTLCGDVDFEPVKRKAGWITPVPGGVGPMTIAMLLKNTVQLWKSNEKKF